MESSPWSVQTRHLLEVAEGEVRVAFGADDGLCFDSDRCATFWRSSHLRVTADADRSRRSSDCRSAIPGQSA
jgi:hypothetical protein